MAKKKARGGGGGGGRGGRGGMRGGGPRTRAARAAARAGRGPLQTPLNVAGGAGTRREAEGIEGVAAETQFYQERYAIAVTRLQEGSMTPRERVSKAVNHQVPDRVPIDLGGMKASGIAVSAYDKVKRKLGIAHARPRSSTRAS